MTPQEEDEQPSAPLKKGPSFITAMASYAVIALIAAFTLDGKFLWVVWIFLAGLALRTWLLTLKKP